MHGNPAVLRTSGTTKRRAFTGATVGGIVLASGFLLLHRERPLAPAAKVSTPVTEEQERTPGFAKTRSRAARPQTARGASTAGPVSQDALLRALPVGPESPVIVFEVNALRYSALGERFVACVRKQDAGKFATIVRETGVDPLRDIDRLAFVGNAVVVTGDFAHAQWQNLGGTAEAYGQSGRVFATPKMVVGAWGDGVVVLSSSAESVKKAIDQLEGRTTAPTTTFPDHTEDGEIYGFLPGGAAKAMLASGGAEGGLTARLASLADRMEISVDARSDVNLALHVMTKDAAGVDGLAAELGAAFKTAQSLGDRSISALLSGAQVKAHDKELTIQLAIPAARLDDLLNDCKIFGPPAQNMSASPLPK